MAPGTEFARDFCAGIGPLQLGVVLVYLINLIAISRKFKMYYLQLFLKIKNTLTL